MSGARSDPPELEGFRYIEWLGGGGFADVFRYEQTVLGREVAVKVLHRGIGRSALDAFRSEANLMAKLSNHPSIVSIYQAGVSGDDRPFLVMEMCPSNHLGARIAQRTFSVQRTLELGVQICGAVETAHGQGILHRDIKPANILFTEFGRPALTDFGISVSVEASSGTSGRALSPPWAPPEQFGNSSFPMGPWSDVYSLAATLWATLVGRSPMELPQGPNDALSIGARVRNTSAPRTGRGDVPESLERALGVALAKDPQQRYQGALELARALQGIQAEQHLSVTTVDVLADEVDEEYENSETGTRVGGFQLIDPDLPQVTGTETSNTARTAGSTQMVAPRETTDWLPQSGAFVLQHGRGVAPAVEPLDFTGPAVVEVEHAPTYIPDEVEAEVPVERKRRWPLIVAGLAVILVVAIVGLLLLGNLGAGTSTEPGTEQSSTPVPADPVGKPVPKVTGLTGTRTGDQVTFTWSNPDPQDGDSYSYWVRELDADPSPDVVDETTVTVPAQEGKTCIEVELVRSNGRLSNPERSCVE